ncbi:MAG: hypothetical protein ABSH38_15730 [Verrucomicrobiota bacterium]
MPIKVKIRPKVDPDIPSLSANGHPVDTDATFNRLAGIYTFDVDTTLLPNGPVELRCYADFQQMNPPEVRNNFPSPPLHVMVYNPISFSDIYDAKGNLVQYHFDGIFSETVAQFRFLIWPSLTNGPGPADYEIDIYNATGSKLVNVVRGSTTNGLAQPRWFLTDLKGNHFTESTFKCQIRAWWPSRSAYQSAVPGSGTAATAR